jgi:O-antigen/teichoic acid export membrane protein
MIIALSIFIAYSIDTWIVQSILGSTKVTEFNLHYRLYVVMITFATALTPVLWRSHSIDEQSRSAILKKSTYLSIATFIVGLLIWPVAREIIPFLSDNEVQINNSIYSCFLLLSIIFSFQVVVSSALLDNRGISIQAITTALMAFFNLLLSIELTNKFGIVGPIFGSILSLLFCQTIPLIFFLKPSLSKVETG